jgi:hypothetical protein
MLLLQSVSIASDHILPPTDWGQKRHTSTHRTYLASEQMSETDDDFTLKDSYKIFEVSKRGEKVTIKNRAGVETS